MILNWRWFISKTLREACEDHKHIRKLLDAQRDLLKEEKIESLQKSLDNLKEHCQGPLNLEELKEAREDLMTTAETVLIPYEDRNWRDMIETSLVVITLVLAFRTFFFQPFKIPTGSMQPTLYGITIENYLETHTCQNSEQGILTSYSEVFKPADAGRTLIFENGKEVEISEWLSKKTVKIESEENFDDLHFTFKQNEFPNFWGRFKGWFSGYSYHSLKAEGNWTLVNVSEPSSIPIFKKQTLYFRDETGKKIKKTIWFPPIKTGPLLPAYIPKREFKEGEYVYKLRLKTGDHLFVNRITYNFRQPKRGDIAVFIMNDRDATHYGGNLDPLAMTPVTMDDTFYIKRLVALGGERVSIGRDNHLVVDGRRLDSATPRFEYVYSHPKRFVLGSEGYFREYAHQYAIDSQYSGHESSRLINEHPFHVTENHYLMFGDNTASSSDSRMWGAIKRENVIGHASFVYWPPFTPRFGWGHR